MVELALLDLFLEITPAQLTPVIADDKADELAIVEGKLADRFVKRERATQRFLNEQESDYWENVISGEQTKSKR